MKWICEVCGVPCEVTVDSSEIGNPAGCLFWHERDADWRRVEDEDV